MKRVLAVLLTFVISQSAFAAEREEKRELIAELLEVLDVKALTQASFDALFEGMAEMERQSMGEADGEERAAIEEGLAAQKKQMEEYRNRLYTRIDYAAYAEQVYAPIFDSHFNADELRGLIAFLKTKPGQKLTAALPELGVGAFVRGSMVMQQAAEETAQEIAAEEQRKHPWRRAMADMRTIATALEARATDVNSYPDVDFDGLPALISPTYIRTVPETDPWGTKFLYVGTAEHYRLVSAGADRRFEWNARQFDTIDESNQPRMTDDPDADIIFQDGMFVQAPSASGQ
jgi:hypothetical protein